MLGNRFLIYIRPAFLVLIVLIAPNMVPADYIKPLPDEVVSVESKKGYEDSEKAASDYRPIPAWLSSVLNWLPTENYENGTVAFNDEELNKDIDENFTSPKKPESSVDAGNTVYLKDISPLYKSPKINGEGIWATTGAPVAGDGRPLVYKTLFRPSVEFPNTIVYLAVFDMSRLKPRLFIGRTEPGIHNISRTESQESLSKIVAITNAMWMQRHARGAGAIFRGAVIYPMVPGMATLAVYQDDSVDVLEWSDEIPLSTVKDARQLSHLILKNGKVVDKVVTNGKIADSEIGLGGSLIDPDGTSTMDRDYWYLANRTAFGIRDDGNLVFAMGHHVSTKDLARALALAECKRAIHGDANIHNVVCNFYFRDEENKIVKYDKLSPEQLDYTLKRYDKGYTKDFFAFYEK
jgi:hypothetical protein